jgi:chromosome segregation ATPase
MKRFFDVFNLLGIGALAWLCVAQWTTNGQLSRENDRLETIRLQQAATIETQRQTIAGQAEDLDEFRSRLATAETQLKDLTLQLEKVTAEKKQAITDRDRLKATLDQWVAAVKQRDDLIKDLARQRNDAIAQLKDVVDKYNALVKKVNGQ